MDSKNISINLLNEFEELKKILIKENEKNWVRGILAIIEKIERALSKDEALSNEYLEGACNIWKIMEQGNGSFSDFYIWRDDLKERKKANNELVSVKNNIWLIVNENNL